jgi:hypothetical protein
MGITFLQVYFELRWIQPFFFFFLNCDRLPVELISYTVETCESIGNGKIN